MMTPGQYLKLRRQASGLSLDDVAALVRTSPRLGEVDRRAWIDRIERDIAAISPDVVATLADVYGFSRRILQQLIDLRSYGYVAGTLEEPRICILCGCSQLDACFDGHVTCAWATPDRCTTCTPVSVTLPQEF